MGAILFWILMGLYVLAMTASELAIPVFLVFLVLKLVNVITWSWLVVCIPVIALPVLIVLAIVAGCLAVDQGKRSD